MHEELKNRLGIRCANCSTCKHLSAEEEFDSEFPSSYFSFPVCDKFVNYKNLKSFPFRTEQKCWEPDFLSASSN